jgi:hypothetical protein
MAQVFILDSVDNLAVNESNFGANSNRYWGDEPKLIFTIHFSELNRLAEKNGFAGVRVIDIEDPKEVRVRWIAFSKSKEDEFRAKDTNDYFFFLSDSVIRSVLDLDTTEADVKKVLVFRLLKESDGNYSGLFSLGIISESGIGTGSPSAGAKIPPNQ